MYYQGFTLDANTMDTNATGFTYAINAPYVGPIARFCAGGTYDMQFNAKYGGIGDGLAFRTRNGDAGVWNAWRDITFFEANGYLFAKSWINQPHSTGTYWDNGTHWFSTSDGSMRLRASNIGRAEIGFEVSGAMRGYVYADNANNIGFLGFDGNWALRVDSGKNAFLGGSFTASGNVTGFSDIRLKTDIKPIDNALNKVRAIRGVTFKRVDTGLIQAGVIAQEVEMVLPEVVVTGTDGYKSVAYGNIVSLLIEAIKELSNELNVLKRGGC
jgi:hypothetical protein